MDIRLAQTHTTECVYLHDPGRISPAFSNFRSTPFRNTVRTLELALISPVTQHLIPSRTLPVVGCKKLEELKVEGL